MNSATMRYFDFGVITNSNQSTKTADQSSASFERFRSCFYKLGPVQAQTTARNFNCSMYTLCTVLDLAGVVSLDGTYHYHYFMVADSHLVGIWLVGLGLVGNHIQSLPLMEIWMERVSNCQLLTLSKSCYFYLDDDDGEDCVMMSCRSCWLEYW